MAVANYHACTLVSLSLSPLPAAIGCTMLKKNGGGPMCVRTISVSVSCVGFSLEVIYVLSEQTLLSASGPETVASWWRTK